MVKKKHAGLMFDVWCTMYECTINSALVCGIHRTSYFVHRFI